MYIHLLSLLWCNLRAIHVQKLANWAVTVTTQVDLERPIYGQMLLLKMGNTQSLIFTDMYFA